MKDLYLAGGPFYGLQEVFSRMRGVEEVVAGFANSSVPYPTRQQVAAGNTGAVECVKVTYNPKKIDIADILSLFFKVVDPYTDGVQGEAEGPQYRSGVYYTSGEDVPQIEYYACYMQSRGGEPIAALGNLIVNDSISRGKERPPMLTEYKRLENFYPAPESEQHYLRSHPDAYTPINIEALVRDGLIK